MLELCRVVTDFDNVKFSNNSILGRAKRPLDLWSLARQESRVDLQVLREFFASRSNFVRFACKESGIAERICVTPKTISKIRKEITFGKD